MHLDARCENTGNQRAASLQTMQGGTPGDFKYDIANSPYGYLFIFNDNQEERETKHPGKGNAAVRIHNEVSGTRPRAMGRAERCIYLGMHAVRTHLLC